MTAKKIEAWEMFGWYSSGWWDFLRDWIRNASEMDYHGAIVGSEGAIVLGFQLRGV